MAGDKPKGLLAKHGETLIRNGYHIVPIMRGGKLPPFNGWQQTQADVTLLKAWLSGKFAAKRGKKGEEHDFKYTTGPVDGAGILTTDTPAVDIDVKDLKMAVAVEEFTRLLLGDAPMRIGNPPKRLLLYRTDEPFRKVQSSIWTSPDGESHKVEILGQGQQFVAIHIHPDTGKAYQWPGGKNPVNTPVDALPTITVEYARDIVAEFERLAQKAGWSRKPGGISAAQGSVDETDPFVEDRSKPIISEEELHKKLLLVPGVDDYDTWYQIGMALHHHFDGGDRGLELWHEWSQPGNEYSVEALDEKWPTFEIEGKRRAPMTARIIIKLANEAQTVLYTETMAEVEDQLKDATDRATLKAACERIKHLEIDQLTRETLIGVIQKKFKSITGQPLRIGVARDMIRFENPEIRALPHWLDGWVYCTHPETFYNMKTHEELSQGAFNNVFGRFMLTKKDILEGRSSPEHVPHHVALHLHQIEVVENRMYMPNDDTLFWINGRRYVNNYTDRLVPITPEVISERDQRNVDLVLAHAEHLFEVERDRELMLDYIAHLVQGGERPDWAVLLQGTQQDGKTFYYRLLCAMLGKDNCISVAADALEEKYTPWAEGHQLVFFEEVKLHGHNRFDVLNKLKPKITNESVDVRRMGVDRYEAVNTSAYFLTTNFRDALPLDDEDSRYFVLFSRFQHQPDLIEWKRKNPKYYDRLHEALYESTGAIRRYFLNRIQSPEFNHRGRAPSSAARQEMIGYSMSDERSVLDEILDESTEADLSSYLLNSRKVSDAMHERDVEPPYGRAMTRMLLDAGFTRMKKVRIGDTTDLYWSRRPQLFRRKKPGPYKDDFDEAKIKGWVNSGL